MTFTLLSTFKKYVWEKIQDDISRGRVPSSDAIRYLIQDDMIVMVSWEINKNVITSELDISVFIEGLPDYGSENKKAKIDVQISIPSQDTCNIESIDVNVTNWDEVFDAKYESLPDMIRDSWNET